MNINDCKEYLNKTIDLYKNSPKKTKTCAFIFAVIIGILLAIPFICLAYNAFMQFLGLKYCLIGILVVCGIILHILISICYSVYYLSLNELNKDLFKTDVISFKKIFIAALLDLFSIIIILLVVIIFSILLIVLLF